MTRMLDPARRWSARAPARHGQRGIVLVLALIFLLLMTILAISASGRSLLQERMVGGLRNAQLAEWSAETALRGAEWQLFSGAAGIGCYNSSNPSHISAKVTAFRASSAWVVSGATTYTGIDWTKLTDNSALADNPVFIIEYLGVDQSPDVGGGRAAESGSSAAGTSEMYLYRITARARGANANTVRILETTFVTPNLVACTLA